ncbi:hypothetical protein M1M94_01415 [Thermodesulfovibrionales bacterium]|nr:hypothetical protein [Thermodesulfovibrionales bacterium]
MAKKIELEHDWAEILDRPKWVEGGERIELPINGDLVWRMPQPAVGPIAVPTPTQPQPIVRGLDNKPPLLVSTSYTPRSISLTFNEPMGKDFCITIQTSVYGFFADPVGDWSGEWSNNHKTFTLTHGTNLPPGSTVTYVINDPNIPPPGKFSDFSTNLAPTTTGGFIVKTSQLVTPIKK